MIARPDPDFLTLISADFRLLVESPTPMKTREDIVRVIGLLLLPIDCFWNSRYI